MLSGWVNPYTGEFKEQNPGWNFGVFVEESKGWILDRYPRVDEVGDDEYTLGCNASGDVFVIKGLTLREAALGSYAWVPRPAPISLDRDKSLIATVARVRTQHIRSKNFAMTDLYHEDIGRLLDAACRVNDLENQMLLLRQWCREETGVETNDVIGRDDWPNTLVGCVVKAFSDRDMSCL